jgi:membrane protease YdiL (CAAX protease family)
MSALSIKLRLHQSLKLDYKLDAISLGLFTFNVLLSAYLVTIAANVGSTDISYKAILMLLLTIVGLIGYMVVYGKFPAIDQTLDPTETSEIIAASVIGFIFVLLLQTTVIRAYMPVLGASIGEIPARLLLVNIAIGEEFFFRFFIQSSLVKQLSYTMPMSQATIGAILGTSVIMTVYHYVYYGMAWALTAVFVSSLVLGAVYAVTRRLSVSTIVHILVNLT